MGEKRWRRRSGRTSDIPAKTSRVLALIFFCLAAVSARVWHLSVVQADARREEARRPQHRVVYENAERGTITDRFGLPLAVNRIQFNGGVRYADLWEIPPVAWEKGEEGKKTKKYPRRRHIEGLSRLLGDLLEMDAGFVEDQIYSRAALFPHVPFVLKADISEAAYYRLKGLEKDWPGLSAERTSRRVYPMGRAAGDLVGYMGAISRAQYDAFVDEMRGLEEWLERWVLGEEVDFPAGFASVVQVEDRLREMRDRVYALNDHVGRTGVEEAFEDTLRGTRGRRVYYSNAKGDFLRELPGGQQRKAGESVRLSISAELQQYAEELLVRAEDIRAGRSTHQDQVLPQPWIKGGAIVAMDPHTGEVVAMASHPRLDPNDFLNGQSGGERQIHHWLEDERHLAAVWNGQEPLRRERFRRGRLEEEAVWLKWESYLAFILPESNPLRAILGQEMQLADAVALQQAVEEMMGLTHQDSPVSLLNILYTEEGGHRPFRQKILSRPDREQVDRNLALSEERIAVVRRVLDRYFNRLSHNYDKLLLVDLCRVAVDHRLFSPELLRVVGHYSLADFREASNAVQTLLAHLERALAQEFHEIDFKGWRATFQSDFLKQKRVEEKEAKVYQRPYLDHLEREEKGQFQSFWAAYGLWFLRHRITGDIPPDLAMRPNLAPYLEVNWEGTRDAGLRGAAEALSHLRQTFKDGRVLFQYLSAMRGFDQMTRPLYGRYRGLRREDGVQLEKHLAAAFYPQYGFGFGRSYAYRSGVAQGSLFKLVVAYEALIQQAKKMVEGARLNPLEIVDQTHRPQGSASAWNLGFFEDGTPIPQVYKGGRIPKSKSRHIGHVDLPRAVEWSSNPYFALLAVDHVADPNDLLIAARQFGYGVASGIELPGEISGKVPSDLSGNPTGLYEFSIGQHQFVATPLQAAVMLSGLVNGGRILRPTITAVEDSASPRWTVPMPREVSQPILEGMERAAKRGQTRSLYVLKRYYQDFPEALDTFARMQGQLLGKTSTSEVVETVNLDWDLGTNIYNHIWFGSSIKGENGEPELVVVVFLKYGGYGMEAAPLASELARKWREIKKKQSV